MDLLLSTFLVLSVFAALGAAVRLGQRRRREQAIQIPDHLVVKLARGVPARVFVAKDVMDGPKAGRINRSPADVVLTADRLIIATGHGRVLELKAGDVAPGAKLGPDDGGASVRCTGPRRLVVEGTRLRRSGPMHVRVELIIDEAELWAAMAAQRLGPRAGAMGA